LSIAGAWLVRPISAGLLVGLVLVGSLVMLILEGGKCQPEIKRVHVLLAHTFVLLVYLKAKASGSWLRSGRESNEPETSRIEVVETSLASRSILYTSGAVSTVPSLSIGSDLTTDPTLLILDTVGSASCLLCHRRIWSLRQSVKNPSRI
jgi:hypothetical protein